MPAKLFIGLATAWSLALSVSAGSQHQHQHLHQHRHSHPHQPYNQNATYWLESIKHQGVAPFNSNASYAVFRNVKDYGAVGDGKHDDTAAINLAISSGGRCAPGKCQSSTVSPAVVYFPAGTYNITSSIIDYYYTQIIGNPNDVPVIKADKSFNVGGTFGLIDGDQYGANGLGFGSTNTFYRQIRNFIVDMTAIPANLSATGIHWPTAQATSLQNIVFRMSDAPGSLHRGVFCEEGSAGFMTSLSFYGGASGMIVGNQQFTMQNLNFYNAQASAIQQLWDWGWTYKQINIYNCSVGIDMSAVASGKQEVGSLTFVDSSITDTPIGILTAYSSTSQPPTAGSLILENVVLQNVPIAVKGASGTILAGSIGTSTILGFAEGHKYAPTGPVAVEGNSSPIPRPASLIRGTKFYEQAKPGYDKLPVSSFVSARTCGAKGDGKTDDTSALNEMFASAARAGQVVFVDAGTYLVTSTITIPPGSRVVGETYSVIMGSGAYFSSINAPQPVVRVGTAGQAGYVEWSDMIVSTQGATAGAILIEWNLASFASNPSGMWDVHTRIGGFAGSNLQVAQCPTTPKQVNYVNSKCIAAFMSMHVTPQASGLYMENVWLWTADHDIEDPTSTQVSVFTGRGLYIESKVGNIWLVGTAVEHHALYQYQFSNTKSIFAGQVQTETPYYQPNPDASTPFAPLKAYNDPNFATYCAGKTGNCASAWGIRVLKSHDILFYGVGLYSFFSNYNTTCSNYNNGEYCQTQILAIDDGGGSGIGTGSTAYFYNLNTIGSISMVNREGKSMANYSDNVNVFPDTIALYRPK